ncbi:thiol-disulfide oxidoreductase DCC family protein [Ekhidna sp.]|uniref:thiol-disulfide oxidoreductase DCC family protein n=1 Tax=Ekhidna sp. TaxID=2608089 RepID=UPI003518C5FA
MQFILQRDKKKKFLFASLQSGFANENLPLDLSDSENLQSIILKDSNSLYTKSSAVLTIAKSLNGLWPIFYIFIVIPKPLRDWVYSIVAKNRYKWFGKKDYCMIPSPELKNRFLD